MLQPLRSLVENVSEQVALNILCSSFSFPLTDKLEANKPCIVISQERLDIEALLKDISSNPEAIALSARDDLSTPVMKKVKDELNLDKFDSIMIWRGGLDLLAVKLPNKVGRSVYIEINDYRRALMTVLAPKDLSVLYSSILSSIMVAGFCGLMYLYANNKK